MSGEILVRGSIQLSWACYAACVALQAVPSLAWLRRWWRLLWTIAWMAMIAHFLLAFQYYHHWSHQHAQQETARQTLEWIGWEFGAGVYFSYLALAIWTLDRCLGGQPFATESVAVPNTLDRTIDSRQRLARRVHFVAQGYLFFIILSGMVLFQRGWYRVGGVAVMALALYGLIRVAARPSVGEPATG